MIAELSELFSLGGLVFADYDGLRHMGLLVLFGNAFALLGATTLLPAAIQLRELGVGPFGVVGIDEGVGQKLEDL